MEGRTSLQNKSGFDPPFAAPPLFWRDGGVGGSGMLSILDNHAGSHEASAPSMPSTAGLDDECATLPVTSAKRAYGVAVLGRAACFVTHGSEKFW